MHILTKVFVVLVSLLAVALVPLAAVQGNNQAALRQQIKDRDVQVSAAKSELATERALRSKAENDTALQIKDLDAEKNRLQSDLQQSALRVRSLDADIAQAKLLLARLEQSLAVTIDVDRTKTELTKTLSEELDKQRTMLVDCEKIRIDIEQKLVKTDSDLRVARESLAESREQVVALSSERVKSDQVVQSYTARYGPADALAAAGPVVQIPDRDLTARIVNVRRSDDRVYAEIDAGSRDGVKVGWLMTIGDDSYVGKIRITSVDVNKSVGTVESEDVERRGEVRVGQRVLVRKGQ